MLDGVVPVGSAYLFSKPGLVAGRGAAAPAVPAALGMTYFLPSPTTCFTDAGTTPAAVGDLVYQINSSYGTATFTQATAGNRLTLRQTGGGKYYLEGAAGRHMTTAATYSQATNQPCTLALSGRYQSHPGTACALAVGTPGPAGAFRGLFSVGGGTRLFAGWSRDTTYTGGWGTTNGSQVVTAAGTDLVDPEWYTDGSSVAVTVPAASGQYGAFTNGTFQLNCYLDPAVQGTGNYLFFGWGWRLGTAKLTAGEVALLTAFQQELYA